MMSGEVGDERNPDVPMMSESKLLDHDSMKDGGRKSGPESGGKEARASRRPESNDGLLLHSCCRTKNRPPRSYFPGVLGSWLVSSVRVLNGESPISSTVGRVDPFIDRPRSIGRAGTRGTEQAGPWPGQVKGRPVNWVGMEVYRNKSTWFSSVGRPDSNNPSRSECHC